MNYCKSGPYAILLYVYSYCHVVLLLHIFCMHRFELEVDEDHIIELNAVAILKTVNGIKLKLNSSV